MTYGLQGRLVAKPGRRHALIAKARPLIASMGAPLELRPAGSQGLD